MQNNANEMAVFNTAIYVRLSKEDIVAAQSGRESNSITNQKQLILDFLKDKPEFNIVSIRIDDGYTGTNFDRPAFQRMLNDIKAGRINCVVVKDYCAIIGLNQKDLENQGILAWSLLFLTENKGLSQ